MGRREGGEDEERRRKEERERETDRPERRATDRLEALATCPPRLDCLSCPYYYYLLLCYYFTTAYYYYHHFYYSVLFWLLSLIIRGQGTYTGMVWGIGLHMEMEIQEDRRQEQTDRLSRFSCIARSSASPVFPTLLSRPIGPSLSGPWFSPTARVQRRITGILLLLGLLSGFAAVDPSCPEILLVQSVGTEGARPQISVAATVTAGLSMSVCLAWLRVMLHHSFLWPKGWEFGPRHADVCTLYTRRIRVPGLIHHIQLPVNEGNRYSWKMPVLSIPTASLRQCNISLRH